eukprot:7312820-Alexandrium_andersonii.AAC.1
MADAVLRLLVAALSSRVGAALLANFMIANPAVRMGLRRAPCQHSDWLARHDKHVCDSRRPTAFH